MANTHSKLDISKLKPSLDEIISVAMLFPITDIRREQMWDLIIKDEDLTKQLVLRLKGNTTEHIPTMRVV